MSNIVRWDPMQEMRQMRRTLDRFFEDWTPFGDDALQANTLALRLDIDEDDEAYHLRTEMPGMKPDDIRVRQEGDYLLIEGEVREETETGGNQKPLIRERRFGRYSRRVRLPQPINVEQAEAQYDRGVLTLTLPKAPTAAPKQIPVKVASAS